MRLAVYSDLHLEFAPFAPPAPATLGADVVVLAGDVDVKRRGARWAAAAFGPTPVVYVAGNHEPYGDALQPTLTALRADGVGRGVHVLENDAVVLAGVRFLGCTLWTDCRYFAATPEEPAAYGLAEWDMQDYRRIRVAPDYRRLRARDTAAMHLRSRRWLERALAEPFAGPTVVVTHHAPSARSVAPAFRRDAASVAYASHLDALVAPGGPLAGAAVWCHGHTHYCVDYRLGDTRVVANPRGYPDEPARGEDGRRFDPAFVVDAG